MTPVPRHARRQPARWLPVLGGGVVLRLGADLLDGTIAAVVAVAGLLTLIAFLAANVHLQGTFVIGTGVALNLAVIVANGAMPVEPAAAVEARIVSRDEVADVTWRGPRRMARSGDRLRFLDDRIPVTALRQTVSAGDVVLGVGLLDFGFHLVRRVRRQPPA